MQCIAKNAKVGSTRTVSEICVTSNGDRFFFLGVVLFVVAWIVHYDIRRLKLQAEE